MNNILVRAIIAIIIGAVVAFIAEKICVHFAIDPFWGWLLGVAAALIYFFGYDHYNSPRLP